MFVVVEAFVNENVLSKKIDQTQPKNFTIKSIFEQDSSEKHKKKHGHESQQKMQFVCVCVGVRVCLCTKSLEIKSQKITK